VRAARALMPLAILLLASAALPVAEADHVYSHRFVMEGRVLDAEGLPVPGLPVEFYSVGWSAGAACQREPPAAVTDENGDFRFCYHVHEVSASWRVGVLVNGTRCPDCERPMDTAFRRTVITTVLENETGVAPSEWERTYSVTGKVWRRGATLLEDVPVHGLAITDAPVNVTLRLPDGTSTEEQLVTDGFGDFDGTFLLEEGVNASEVEMVLETMGQRQTRPLATSAHRQTVGFMLPPQDEDARGIELNFPQGADSAATRDPPPGATAPAVPAALFIGVAVAAVGWIFARKWRERREQP
jgi:hypothetical protein